jgi:hypothetical protein
LQGKVSANYILRFLGDEYVGFQFSKHDGFAQRLSISNFQLCCFEESFSRVQPNLSKPNQHEQNSKQSKL